MNLERLSKKVSYILRHAAWEYELEIDDEGWTPVEDLLQYLRNDESHDWSKLNVHHLEQMIASSDKRRHETQGGKIRALYGHSLPGRLRKQSQAPPSVLYHGTPMDNANQILEKGLQPMGRQYVHLSVDVDTAQRVGKRKSAKPTVLKVLASRAYGEGIPFYIGSEMVWLAAYVPPEYIAMI